MDMEIEIEMVKAALEEAVGQYPANCLGGDKCSGRRRRI